MLLAFALIALATPQTTPAGVKEEEMLCVFDGLDEAKLAELAGLALSDDEEAGREIIRTAGAAIDKCAATWKWTGRGSAAGALTAAAFAGMMMQDHALAGRVSEKQLKAIFDKMSKQDRAWLTFEGGRSFPAAQAKPFTDRFEALAKREGVKPADFAPVAFYLKSGARYVEMQGAWAEIDRTGTR
jgi:hypothetical protein